MLTKEKKKLLNKLYEGFRSNEDVNELLRDILKEDLLVIFKARHKKNRDTILGSHESLKVEQVQAVLNRAKELDISFEEIASRIIFVLSFDSKEEKQKYISLIVCIKNPDFKFLPEVLHAINESYGLESFWKVISEDDCERIKNKLVEDGHKDILDEINRIETTIAAKNQPVQTDIDYDSLSETDSDVTVAGDSVHTTEKISSTEKNLYLDLQNAIDKKEDIAGILKSATKEDLLSTFAEREEQEENANLLYNILQEAKHRLAFFKEVKEKGILQDLLNANLSFMKTRQLVDVDNETKTLNIDTEYKLVEYIIDPKASNLLVLDEIKEVFGFEDFWKASSEADRNMIKGALKREIGKLENDQEKSKYENYLEEIKTIESEQKLNTLILRASTRTLDFGDHRESRKEAAKKGMKFGAIGSAITALAVGLGLYFGTGAALTVLPTIIGIALVAALFVGATIGAITYDILKPKNCVDTVRVFKEFDTIKQEANTAAM